MEITNDGGVMDWFREMYFKSRIWELGLTIEEYMEEPMKFLNIQEWVRQTGGLLTK